MSKGRNHASRRLKAQQSTNQVLGNQPNTRRKQTRRRNHQKVFRASELEVHWRRFIPAS